MHAWVVAFPAAGAFEGYMHTAVLQALVSPHSQEIINQLPCVPCGKEKNMCEFTHVVFFATTGESSRANQVLEKILTVLILQRTMMWCKQSQSSFREDSDSSTSTQSGA